MSNYEIPVNSLRPDEEHLLDRAAEFQRSVLRHVKYSLGRRWADISKPEQFRAIALAVRDRLVEGMIETEERYEHADAKRLYYLSMEILVGRSLGNNLHNLGLHELCERLLASMGVDLEEVRGQERDAALGNGGLGRLAACFLDSLATLGMPGYGYGINYEYGLFKQEIESGEQKEVPDSWRSSGSPWLIERPAEACVVPLYGRVEEGRDRDGNHNPMWVDWKAIVGVPSDMPVVGYGGRTVNYLRLFTARAANEFHMSAFNDGSYIKAVEEKIASETVSKVLYPSDSNEGGRELRLIQEYFFVACALRDVFRKFETRHNDYDRFPSKVAIQLNDTHPAIAVAELMRLFVDEKSLAWERAWRLTRETLGYTNHTLMPEALEKWPVPLFERVLPRHLQIIYEINHRFLGEVRGRWPGDEHRQRRMSLIEEGECRQIRMGHLAIVGSHSVNGVSALHSDLVKKSLVPDFHQLWPEKFNNKTNGVTQRRWLLKSNPSLAGLITRIIGDAWVTDLRELRGLEPYADDAAFREEFMEVKLGNKLRLAKVIKETTGVSVDPRSMFDVQAKRIHEYKRQTLKVLHVIHEYLNLVESGNQPPAPRTYIFAGKAAPGYWAAKQIIKLIHSVARIVNEDPHCAGMMKVVFIPDYRVSLAERIIPAADLSEQISTAGMEASGTGNMKFALNGALTIGTLDGANVEIQEEVGPDNIFIFGLKPEEVLEHERADDYFPQLYYSTDSDIRRVLDALNTGRFSPEEPAAFAHLFKTLLQRGEQYFHLADMSSYLRTQKRAAAEFGDRDGWAHKAVLNVARSGKFSSDRTVADYAQEIWQVEPVL